MCSDAAWRDAEPDVVDRAYADPPCLPTWLLWTDAGTFTDKGTNSVANILLTLLTWIVRGAITIVQWAFSLQLVHTLTAGLAAPAGALKRAVYDSLLVVVVALSGLWLLGLWMSVLVTKFNTACARLRIDQKCEEGERQEVHVEKQSVNETRCAIQSEDSFV